MASSLIRIDDEVIAELVRRATVPGSYNGRLRQIFGMPPPRPRGAMKGQKRAKKKK
jgi:hypothetical protein